MKASAAIRQFINTQGYNPNISYPRITVAELRDFKEICTKEEYAEFGMQACTLIGEVFEA